MTSTFRHSLIVLTIVIATAALYYNVTKSYFCSYDDFVEVHRAAFVDASNPKAMFTTTHFNSFKYRPLNRALNLLTYEMDHRRAVAFRARNLLFHLLNIALIYWMAILLRKSIAVAATAALLFAVHPLANQAVIGAVMTNNAAYSMYLLAIVFFVLATRNRNREVLYVSLAGMFGIVSLFTYESNIVVFGAMAAYLAILHFVLGQPVTKRLVVAWSAVTVCSLGLYLGARQLFMASAYHAAARSIVSPRLALWNIATYVGALLQVFDPVLLNRWLGSPLPPDPDFFHGLHGGLLIAWTVAALLAIGLVIFRLIRSSRPSESWSVDAFLVVAGWLPILPMLLLATHPSETYLYLTVALMTLALVSLLYDFYRSGLAPGWLLLVCGICLALLFGSATRVRNRRVAACGATAHKILSAISFGGLRDGAVLGFFDAGGQIAKPYGYYRFDGLNTVGKDWRDMQCAAQLVSGNDKIRAQILDREELDRVELQHQPASYDELIVVRADGNITQRKTAIP